MPKYKTISGQSINRANAWSRKLRASGVCILLLVINSIYTLLIFNIKFCRAELHTRQASVGSLPWCVGSVWEGSLRFSERFYFSQVLNSKFIFSNDSPAQETQMQQPLSMALAARREEYDLRELAVNYTNFSKMILLQIAEANMY